MAIAPPGTSAAKLAELREHCPNAAVIGEVGRDVAHAGGHPERQARLPAAAGTDKRHESVRRDQSPCYRQLTLAAHREQAQQSLADALELERMLLCVDAQHFAHHVVEAFVVEDQRQLVDRLDVLRGDDRVLVDVAEERDLAALILRDRPVAAAEQDVGLDADRPQLADAVLRRLRLQLAGRADERRSARRTPAASCRLR